MTSPPSSNPPAGLSSPLSPPSKPTQAGKPASRPNKLDWLVYRFFRWWWNPILLRKPNLVFGLQNELGKWLKENGFRSNLANSRLIAAAPRLLEALKRLVEDVEKWPSLYQGGDYLHGGALAEPKAAIAEVEREV